MQKLIAPRGLDPARGQAVHPDVQWAELDRQLLAEHAERGVARAARRVQRDGLLRRARDVDDHAAATPAHVGDDRLGATDLAQELAVDRVDERLVRQIDEGPEGRRAGVVDQDVDAAQPLGRPVDEPAAAVERSEIGGDRHDLHPGGPGDLGRRVLQLRLGARADGDAHAFVGQLARDRAADAFAGARHERGLTLEPQLHRVSFIHRRASAGGAPAPRRPAARTTSCTLPRTMPLDPQPGAIMTDQAFHVYVIQGRGERDYADCQAAIAHVPARMTSLPFIGDENELIARTRDADAMVVVSSPVTRAVMSALEGLKTVVRTGVGYDVIDVPAATDLGVVVVNIPDLWIREVANHALTLLLAWNRKLIALNNEVKSGIWQTRVPGPVTGSLHGETVGIVGLGNIGRAFAKRVAALETHVIACDPYVDDARFTTLGVERVSVEGLAARADDVSVHALSNAETRHLINEAFLRRMKPTACLINTSRGPVVDEQALIRALQEKWIAGAALDVRESEPPAT